MTVLFCDLRGFTALSENLEPAVVRMMLNHYYDRVTDIVLAMRGTLMKYVGDEVFAVWGAPLPSDDHPQLRARVRHRDPGAHARSSTVSCSSRGRPRCRSASASTRAKRSPRTSVVVAGGSTTSSGDTVNVGARLCSAAGRGEIILSDAVLTRVTSPLPVEPVGPIELKGVSRELRLWRVVPSGVG